MIYRGSCHCGQIQATYEVRAPVALRACQCSFCRRHGAKTTSDPEGKLTLQLDPDKVVIYRFASRTAEIFLCASCGVYVASSIRDDLGRRIATLNVAGVHIAELWSEPAEPIRYDEEAPAAKRTRRIAKWTPTEIEER